MFIKAKDDGSGGDNWTTGAISRAKFQSNHHQQTNTQFFTGRMSFLSPNQQCQSTEGKISHSMDLLTPSSPGVFQLCLWPLIAPGYLGQVCHASHQPSDASTPGTRTLRLQNFNPMTQFLKYSKLEQNRTLITREPELNKKPKFWVLSHLCSCSISDYVYMMCQKKLNETLVL